MEKELIDEDLKNCTGLFQGNKRKELQAQSDKYTKTIQTMKQGLSHIVQDYKYPTEYESYVRATKEWKSEYGENPIHRKLAEKQAEVQKREQYRDINYQAQFSKRTR